MKTFKSAFLLAFALLFSLHSFAQTEAQEESDSAGVYTIVEVMPEFPGSVGAYLGENLQYPRAAQQAGVEGRVIVRFIIARNGAVKNAYVEKKVHPALDAEALRVVRSMPKWKPGTQGGKTVKVYYRIPIKFTLTFDEDSSVAEAPVDTTLLVSELPLAFAEEMPHFDGDMNSYLQKQLLYPAEAREGGEEGVVSVTFVVEKDGRITGTKVSKSVSPTLDAEALRIVSAMPRWVPGKQSGQPVAVYQSLPITFQQQ